MAGNGSEVSTREERVVIEAPCMGRNGSPSPDRGERRQVITIKSAPPGNVVRKAREAPVSGDHTPLRPRFKLRVLRQSCKDCAGGPQLATRCEESDCPLWDYRTGHRPRGRKAMRTPLKALRAFCLWCADDQPVEVRLCPCGGPPLPCPLWPWRRGRSRTGELPPGSAHETPRPAQNAQRTEQFRGELGPRGQEDLAATRRARCAHQAGVAPSVALARLG